MEPKKMSVKEFRELGYLQELNRVFLHPLGLALETVVDMGEDGIETEHFGGVWDSRDDPEGIIYKHLSNIDAVKAARIQQERVNKGPERYARFGWLVQPPP